MHSLTVMMPALNEEATVAATAAGVLAVFDRGGVDGELILVDDGSTDDTRARMQAVAVQDNRVRLIAHDRRRGIGYSFREVLGTATKEAITWFPADGENTPDDLVRYLPLLEHVDIIVPFAVNCGVRSFFRRVLSSTFLVMINLSFGMHLNYTNGNVIYRRRVFDGVTLRSNGFFFQTEALITAIRLQRGVHCEVPIHLTSRRGGASKAVSLRSLLEVSRDYLRLVWLIHLRPLFLGAA
ncbi:MAG TPA: glycosyltransferase family 2 protein [bacterium]|nr:glycosyltransferase family 2 protein [bacterium]